MQVIVFKVPRVTWLFAAWKMNGTIIFKLSGAKRLL